MNHKDGRVSHGMYGTRIYRIWAAMKRRCYNKNYHEFYLYGGRGIVVCDDWMEFKGFYLWSLQNGYNDTLSIDRINNQGNYEPYNCRWISTKKQANNRRSNILIHYKGEEKTLKEWAENLGLNYKAVWKRIHNGWDVEMAFTKPLKSSDVS
jgi:hypothetical protein